MARKFCERFFEAKPDADRLKVWLRKDQQGAGGLGGLSDLGDLGGMGDFLLSGWF